MLIVGVSAINMALPALAFSRSSDGRFLALTAASGAWALLGAIWAWGQLPGNPPAWTGASLPVLGLALVATLLLLVSTLWPRRA